VSGPILRVACAQLHAHGIEEAETALGEALAAVAEAARRGADLVVLPECTYPAYLILPTPPAVRLRPDHEVEALFAAAARDHRIAVMVGLAQGVFTGSARNAAVLFDGTGTPVLRTAKRFLWDFDGRWFAPGDGSPVVDLAGARLGGLVCADARLPEIARSLALQGARLILDPTAWVTSGRDPLMLSNPQPEFLMRVRALENGAFIAAANKVGTEQDAVVYCGRSGVFAPDGSVVGAASGHEPEILTADVDLTAAEGPPVPRRPELYGTVAAAPRELCAPRRAATPIVPNDAWQRVVLVQSDVLRLGPEIEAWLRAHAPVVEALDAGFLAAAAAGIPSPLAAERAARLAAAAGVPVALGVADGVGRFTHGAWAPRGAAKPFRSSHAPGSADPLDWSGRLLDSGPVRTGVLLGAEGLVPEMARSLALMGAEHVLWFADARTPLAEEVTRARAMENRVYAGAIVAGDPRGGRAFIADPDGRVVAAGLEGHHQIVSGVLQVAAARFKQMAPRTDVLAGRRPQEYGSLVEEAVTAPEAGR
jgi:predicted amidohydrolase